MTGTEQSAMMSKYNRPGQLAQDYAKYNVDKSALLTRCEEYAGWTLPAEFPPIYHNTSATEIQHDFQSIGAKAVNHLSNKLVYTLFAPTRPFFRLDVDDKYLQELEEKFNMKPADVQMALSREEQAAVKRLAGRGIRTALHSVMNQLIITGNTLLYFPVSGGKAQTFSLRDYVCKRDLSGRPLDIITREHKSIQTLPANVRNTLRQMKPQYKNDDMNVFLYTRVRREHTGKFYVMQSVEDLPLQDSWGEYPENALPWIPLTWKLARGADYGTGLVEDYAGDFHSLSVLSESMVIGAAIAAEVKFLVNPAGATDIVALNNARNGDYVPGREEDITTHQIGKTADWQFVLEMIKNYERRIGQAFLLGSAVTREAERVTAEEIRFQAQELETSLGGLYSRLSEDLQLRLAYLALGENSFLINDKRIEPMIITGMESLSRNSDIDNIMLYFQDLSVISQLAENVQDYIKIPEIMAMFGTARSVDYNVFMRSEEEVQDIRAKRQQEVVAQQNAIAQGQAEAQPQ